MDATVVRKLPLSALIVGASGVNVLRIVTAFEQKRIMTLREDTIAAACERIAVDMPHVVLVMIPARSSTEVDALTDRALAVGAHLIHVDPSLEGAELGEVLDDAVRAAIERQLFRESQQPTVAVAPSEPPTEDIDVDDGWG